MTEWIRLLIPSERGSRSLRSPLAPGSVDRLVRAAKRVRRPPGRAWIEPRFSVYVVLLEFAAGDWRLYVGITGTTPEERFLSHKAGHKASRSVRKYGVGLLPRLYEHLNPLDWEPAKEVEVALADALRSTGMPVIQA